jgi:alkylation response protein AidB-like acyl-CoA dehydrogenase
MRATLVPQPVAELPPAPGEEQRGQAMSTESRVEVSEQQARQVAEESREQEWIRPSFGKELFLGRLHLGLIHPHPRPGEEDRRRGEAFLARLRDVLLEIDPLRIEADSKIPEQVIERLAEIGAFGMKIGEEYGGLGLSQVYYNRALVLANSIHGSLGALLSAHMSIGVPQPLRMFGTPEQKRRYLPRLARGAVSAFLLTEPDVGSDPARLATTAVPTEDGSAYVLDGTKLWATNGSIAEILVVMARVPRSQGHPGGISAFVVEAATPGVTVLHRNAFMGLRGIENSVTRFERVRVPAENLIGAEGRGLKIALVTLNTGRLSLPAISAGAAKASLKIAREFAGERVQWGRPVGRHEAVAHKLAFIAGTAFALEAVSELSSGLSDQGHTDIRIEAALAKLFCSEMAWQAADEMVQIRGGRGYETAASLKARGERPVPAEQILRDLRISRIFEGSTEIMKLFIAREAVDTHLRVAGAMIDPGATGSDRVAALGRMAAFYGRWLPTLAVGRGQLPGGYGEFGRLARHLRYVERASRKLARSIFYAMARWQGGLERKQGFLGRAVDIGAELYAISCACVRARMLGEDGSPDAAAAVELADLFCSASRRRIGRLFGDLWANDDTAGYLAARRVLEGRYRWAEDGILDWTEDPAAAAQEESREEAPLTG